MKIEILRPFGVLVRIKNEPIDFNIIKQLFHKHQLLIIRGINSIHSNEEFEKFSSHFGDLVEWPFGKILELKPQKNPADHIFDNSYIPMHWDGMYREEVPEMQIFRCINPPLNTKRGRTIFSHTSKLLNKSSVEDQVKWRQTIGTYHRKMEFYDSKVISPIVCKHPYKNYEVIRLNEPHIDMNKFLINPPVTKFNKNIKCLIKALYERDILYKHEWMKGDIVLADNLTLLHGREAFDTFDQRHIQRIQVHAQNHINNMSLEKFE